MLDSVGYSYVVEEVQEKYLRIEATANTTKAAECSTRNKSTTIFSWKYRADGSGGSAKFAGT